MHARAYAHILSSRLCPLQRLSNQGRYECLCEGVDAHNLALHTKRQTGSKTSAYCSAGRNARSASSLGAGEETQGKGIDDDTSGGCSTILRWNPSTKGLKNIEYT